MNNFFTFSPEWQWVQIHNMYEAVSQHSDPSAHIKQVLHCTIVLFLHCLYMYAAKIDPSQFIGNVTKIDPSQFIGKVLK